jgi:anti-sigma factor RsiW
VDCRDVQHLLHPYSDGELDLVRHLQVEHHLAECAECAERERGLRLLRDTIASAPLYHRAPSALRARLQATPALARRQRWSRRGSAMAVAGAALLAGVFTIGMFWPRKGSSGDDRLVELVLASHIRSLQVDHMTDVASSDQHTVKPWFRGKLDFSPQVPDLSSAGYALSGGRLDYLADRPVAALVYHRRQHVINVFTWPAREDEERPVRSLSRQGFQIRAWQHSGMAYWVISDLNPQELDEFVRLIGEQPSVTAP